MRLNKTVTCKVTLIESFESLFNFKLIPIKGMHYKILTHSLHPHHHRPLWHFVETTFSWLHLNYPLKNLRLAKLDTWNPSKLQKVFEHPEIEDYFPWEHVVFPLFFPW